MSYTLVGHRGVAGHYPENTPVSVQAAIDMGLRWIEVDVQPTKDNILVICHDHKIDRCSNGQGRVDELTYEQLCQHDFGSWFDPRFADQTIMTLSQLLSLAASWQLRLNLEIKIDRHDLRLVVELLTQQLSESPLATEHVLLSSFNHDVIRYAAQLCPNYKLGVLTERLTNKDRKLLDQVDAFSCHVNYRWLTERHLTELQRAGRQVWCYTVNQPETFKLLDQVDGVFSDFPERFYSA